LRLGPRTLEHHLPAARQVDDLVQCHRHRGEQIHAIAGAKVGIAERAHRCRERKTRPVATDEHHRMELVRRSQAIAQPRLLEQRQRALDVNRRRIEIALAPAPHRGVDRLVHEGRHLAPRARRFTLPDRARIRSGPAVAHVRTRGACPLLRSSLCGRADSKRRAAAGVGAEQPQRLRVLKGC